MAALWCAVCSLAGAQSGSPIAYTTFQGDSLTLYPWKGQKVVVLTSSPNLDRATMTSIVSALDSAWRVYEQITGADPDFYPETSLNGLDIIAEVPTGSTCGAACSYLGNTGTEIESTYFNVLYNGVYNNHQFDQALFYELGRNFWFYNAQLGALSPFVTGFAVANRFVSMDNIGVTGGPYNGTLPYAQFEQSVLRGLLQTYLNGPAWNWQNTLAAGDAPPTPNDWSASDLAGSMIHRVYADYGMTAYTAFFRALAAEPAVSTESGAIQNFVAAAKTATGADYSFFFKNTPVTAPQIRPAASGGAPVVNSASFQTGFSPGDLIAILGEGLSFDMVMGSTLLDPSTNAFASQYDSVAVTVNGLACPLIFISPSQINCQIPRETSASAAAPVQVTLSGKASNTETIRIDQTAPALFEDFTTGAPILSNTQTEQVLDAIAIGGKQSYTLWCQGLGPLVNSPANGAACATAPLSKAALPVTLEIGGASATVKYAGCSSGSLVSQINFTVPASATASGSTVDAVLAVGGKQLQFALPVSR